MISTSLPGPRYSTGTDNAHQCRHGLGARMSRHRMSATTRLRESPAVYWEMSQDNVRVGRYSLVIVVQNLTVVGTTHATERFAPRQG
jgi:hypothetical protein